MKVIARLGVDLEASTRPVTFDDSFVERPEDEKLFLLMEAQRDVERMFLLACRRSHEAGVEPRLRGRHIDRFHPNECHLVIDEDGAGALSVGSVVAGKGWPFIADIAGGWHRSLEATIKGMRESSVRAVKGYFEARAARANPDAFRRILAKSGTLPPREGDEIPEGWLEEGYAGNDDASEPKP